jgi:hypothetical protein
MMTIQQIFDLGLKMGINTDPRGESGIKEYLDSVKKGHDDLKDKDKKYFDKIKLDNPYDDSRIHVGEGRTEVKRLMAGIDIDEGEVLLASQLSERDKNIDLVISHHPVGKGLADLHGVMDMQVEVFVQAGVPVHMAEKIMEERIKEVSRGVHPINHYQLIDMARLLKVNLMNTHTITDNLVGDYLTKFIAERKPRLIGDLIDVLLEIPEYQEAKMRGAGPAIFNGSPKNRVGKYLIEMTGGTSPGDKVYTQLSNFGISTTIGMHMKDSARELAGENNMNVLIAGHMASDSLGMNLFLDEIEKQGVEVVPCGGLIRVKR